MLLMCRLFGEAKKKKEKKDIRSELVILLLESFKEIRKGKRRRRGRTNSSRFLRNRISRGKVSYIESKISKRTVEKRRRHRVIIKKKYTDCATRCRSSSRFFLSQNRFVFKNEAEKKI